MCGVVNASVTPNSVQASARAEKRAKFPSADKWPLSGCPHSLAVFDDALGLGAASFATVGFFRKVGEWHRPLALQHHWFQTPWANWDGGWIMPLSFLNGHGEGFLLMPAPDPKASLMLLTGESWQVSPVADPIPSRISRSRG
jgi:hypothetical protein